jgi:hypothetical protein
MSERSQPSLIGRAHALAAVDEAVAAARAGRGQLLLVSGEAGIGMEASIRTGTQCSYQPSGPIGWQL